MTSSTPGPSDPTRKPSDPARPAPADSKPTTTPRSAGFDDKGRVKRTRVSALWVGIILAAILSILVLVFIVQNSDPVDITFLWLEGSISAGVAILLAAIIGVLIVAIPGSIRIAQLRRALTVNEKRTH